MVEVVEVVHQSLGFAREFAPTPSLSLYSVLQPDEHGG